MGVVLVLSSGISSCAYIDKNYGNIVWPKNSAAHVADDTAEIRNLISEAEIRDAKWQPLSMPWGDQGNYKRFVAEYMPLRRRLLEDVDRASGFAVAGGSYCRILEKSRAQCEAEASFYSTTYVRIRVTTGAARGKGGWVCRGKVPVAADWP